MISGKFLGNVFSNMNCTAEYMVVGQNPGSEETEKCEPFVGISGKMFDQLVEEVMEMKRSMFYISNTVRCYTPGNRKPTMEEVSNCRYFMDLEIQALRPKVIITLGGPAFEQVTGIHGIMKHHGKPEFSPRYKVPVFPLLHPSPINLNDPAKMELFVADLVLLEEFIKNGCVL
jgi:DNA polymerase